MTRKALRTLVSEYVLDELEKSEMTVREFAKKVGVPPSTIQKLKNPATKSMQSDSMDQLLQGMEVSLIDIINKYGEYE